MVLEATVIIVDNSEWMRNGDYMPSRIEAQQDAVNLICAAKTQANPESAVSVMSMSKAKSGAKAEVLVTLTQDLGKILSSLHALQISGETDFSAALQVAQLVLKHRQNKNQHQRIVAFVGSPIRETSEDLVKLGKRLKKNNIAVDLVNFGEEAENAEKLENFIKSVNTADESHLITVPAGPHILSDMLLSSAIIVGEGGGGSFGASAAASAAAAAAAASGATGGEYDFGVDPSLDPELAMVLRISMEEERARQRQEEAKRKEQEGGSTAEDKPDALATITDVEMTGEYDDELQQALALSMNTDSTAPAPSAMELTEDELMAQALELSNTTPSNTSATPAPPASDQDFLNSVLQSLPGVDMNDERIRNMLSTLQPEKDEKKDEKK
jgi:26S proteasome regulatory subunit N10